MPGYNHPPDCMCGWCYKTAAAPRPVTDYLFSETRFRTYESFTNPNAICPACKETVFFYQSPYGGKVYFDELGPPWPKHPCTDLSSPPANTTPRDSGRERTIKPAQWLGTQWKPLAIRRILLADEWWVIHAELLQTGEYLRLLPENRPDDSLRSSVAQFSGWDENGYGVISYLNRNTGEPTDFRVYKYSHYILLSPQEVRLKRQSA